MRSIERKRANRIIACHVESTTGDWKGLRAELPSVARQCGVDVGGKRRSQIAIECAKMLVDGGLKVPLDYCPPWERAGHLAPR